MSLYQVKFLDHAQDYSQAISCVVYGKLVREDEVSIEIETWTMEDPRQAADLKDNSSFTIIKAAVTSMVPLYPGDPQEELEDPEDFRVYED